MNSKNPLKKMANRAAKKLKAKKDLQKGGPSAKKNKLDPPSVAPALVADVAVDQGAVPVATAGAAPVAVPLTGGEPQRSFWQQG